MKFISPKGSGSREPGKKKKFPIWRALILLAATLVAVAVYKVASDMYLMMWVFWVYFAALLVLSLAYVIYNRGCSRWTVKRDMLPLDWSEDQKDKFFADSDRWKRHSRWMLYIIIPLMLTFFIDFLMIVLEGYFFTSKV